MTAILRTTVFVLLASLPLGIGGARAQQMEPPRFEQTEPPRILPPPPPPAPRREQPPPAPVPAPAPASPSAPATPPPRQPPSSTQWRQAPAAPPPREPAPPALVPPPRQPPALVPPPRQPPALVPPPRQPPAPVQSPPARVQSPPARVQSPQVRVQAPSPSPARPDADDAIDDPKMWRRLGTRIGVPPTPAVPPPPAPAPPRPRATARRAPAPKPPPPLAPPPPPVSAPAAAVEDDQTTLVRPYTPVREPTFEPTLPRLKLGLRRFDFVRIGASNSPDGVAATQTFNSFAVDVYPVSRVVRVGLTSAFGWESGMFLTNGDYFATQTVSLGAQYRDFGRVVPFAEAFMGVGYMRRVQFDRSIPTAFWNFGADAGVEIYFARVGYLSLALGYMRPVNGFARRQIFTSVFVDTWSVKIGIGI